MIKIVFNEKEKEILNRTYRKALTREVFVNVPGHAKMLLGVQRFVATKELGNPLAENDVQAMYANGLLQVDTGLPEHQVRQAAQKCISSLDDCGEVPQSWTD
ncbi:MAG: hypothetical protein AB1815_11400 [Bacillota bacterium]|jgi:hypothetical protein